MHRFAVALFAGLLACSTTREGTIDRALVGRYEWWGIDSGRFLELRADGTWIEGDVGMGALFFQTCGCWSVSGHTVELRATHDGLRDEPSVRLPLPESVVQTYPRYLDVVVSSAVCELQPRTGPRLPWQRVAPPMGEPREAASR